MTLAPLVAGPDPAPIEAHNAPPGTGTGAAAFGEERRQVAEDKKTRQRRGLVQLPPNRKNGAPRWKASYWFMGRWKRQTFPSKTEAVRWLDSQRGSVADGRHAVPGEEVYFEKAVERFLTWSETNTRDKGHDVDRVNSALWLASPHFAGKLLTKITAWDVEQYRLARLTHLDRRGPSLRGLTALASHLHKSKAGRWLKGPKRAAVRTALAGLIKAHAPARLREALRCYFERPGPYHLEDMGADLEAWIKKAPPTPREKTIAKRTADISIARLKRLFNLCAEWGICEKNPAARVRLLKEDNRRNRYLTQEEEARLLAVCSPVLRRIVLFALHTGMRRGEILGLRWEDVDFRNSVAIIPATRAKGKRDRYIPLNGPALAVLDELPRTLDRSALIFGKRLGNYHESLEREWRAARVQSGLGDFRFHDLRHTYASRLVMSGVDLAVVRELLGHRDFETTLRYAHLAPSRMKEAVSVLGRNYPVAGAQTDQNGPDHPTPHLANEARA